MMSGRNRFPFTATQWQELEHQALIFKYMVSGNPIPPDLLFTVKSSLESSLSSKLILHQPQHCKSTIQLYLLERLDSLVHKNYTCLSIYAYMLVWRKNGVLFDWWVQWGGTVFRWVWGGKLIQSQGGAGEQMERNGDAQKKHTQTQSTVRDTCTEAETVQESLWKQLVLLLIPVDQSTKIQPPLLTLTPPPSLPSHQWPLTPTLTPTTLAITLISTTISFIPIHLLQGLLGMIFLPKKSIPICSWTLVRAPILINITGLSISMSSSTWFFLFMPWTFYWLFNFILSEKNRYGYGMKEEINEQAFFSESSSMEDPWKLTPQTTGSSLAHLKQRSGLQGGGYPFLQHQGLTDTSKQQKNFFEMPLKVEREDQPKKVMHHFFDEWPKNKDSWVDSEGKSSDYVPVSTTQLSISIPNSSYDFFMTRNGNWTRWVKGERNSYRLFFSFWIWILVNSGHFWSA